MTFSHLRYQEKYTFTDTFTNLPIVCYVYASRFRSKMVLSETETLCYTIHHRTLKGSSSPEEQPEPFWCSRHNLISQM